MKFKEWKDVNGVPHKFWERPIPSPWVKGRKYVTTLKKLNMKKIITLSGNFDKTHAIADALAEVESASAALREFTDAGDYGSAEYFDALKAKKAAEAEHAKALRSLRGQ